MGKSMLLRVIMRQDIEQGNGFALFDPHSELAEAILSECSRHPEALEKVWLIEPHSPFIVPFNPLSIPDGLPLYPQVLTLLDLFRRSWSDFWGPRVEEVLRACLITLAEQKLTLAELPLLLTEPSVRKALTGSIRHEETKQFWHRFDSLSPSLQALYAEPVINRVNRFLSDPSVKAMLCSQNGINLSELMDEGAIILINLSKGATQGSFLDRFPPPRPILLGSPIKAKQIEPPTPPLHHLPRRVPKLFDRSGAR
jgi:hypothetical protein